MDRPAPLGSILYLQKDVTSDTSSEPDDPARAAEETLFEDAEINPRSGRSLPVDPEEKGLARLPGPGRGGASSGASAPDRFIAEARRYRRLDEEEERALSHAVRERRDMEAAKTLVVHNLRLVVAIAYQYRRAWANILDLFQEGSLGLMEAVQRWQPALGARFGSYAAYWIRAFILRFLMTNTRMVHVGNTRAGRKLFYRLEKERQRLLASGFEPTPRLLAAKLDVDEQELTEVARHLDSREVSFEAPASRGDDESGPSVGEGLASAGGSPEEDASRRERDDVIGKLVARFQAGITDEREQAIWREHLAAEDPVQLGVLGERFGVSKQRMGQIAARLKAQFRAMILREMGSDVRMDWLD